MINSFITIFAADPRCAPKGFFLLPSWYQYLWESGRVTYNGNSRACEYNVNFIQNGTLNLTSLTLVGLGILDILLRLAGLIAVGFIVWGGIKYITSQGQPENTKQAQGTVVNALIGLIITIIAAALVRFVGSAVGG